MGMIWLVKDPLYNSIRIRPFLQKGFKVLNIEHKRFPDGEEYIRILDEINEEDHYVVILRGFPEQNSNILRGLLIIDTLRDFGARKIIVVWPYLPYSRQDKRFLPGEAISVITLVKVISLLGVSYIITVDVHNESAFKRFKGKIINITTEDLWAEYIARRYNARKIALIAPDKGREEFIRKVAQTLGADYYVFEKRRDLTTGKIVCHSPTDEESIKNAINYADCFIIIDDIIATGGTLANIARWLRTEGFNGKIVVGGIHGLFLGNAVDRLLRSGVDEIIASDTVSNPFIHDELSVSPLLVNAILNIIGEKGERTR